MRKQNSAFIGVVIDMSAITSKAAVVHRGFSAVRCVDQLLQSWLQFRGQS